MAAARRTLGAVPREQTATWGARDVRLAFTHTFGLRSSPVSLPLSFLQAGDAGDAHREPRGDRQHVLGLGTRWRSSGGEH